MSIYSSGAENVDEYGTFVDVALGAVDVRLSVWLEGDLHPAPGHPYGNFDHCAYLSPDQAREIGEQLIAAAMRVGLVGWG